MSFLLKGSFSKGLQNKKSSKLDEYDKGYLESKKASLNYLF